MKLTEHFSIEEFERSQYAERHGINNKMGGDALSCAADLCENLLEPLREIWGKPIHISSGFRCKALNKAIGGAEGSQHTKGQAVDIAASPNDLMDIATRIQKFELPFDQLIYEGSWIHVSYAAFNRGEVLSAKFKDGKAHYSTGLHK